MITKKNKDNETIYLSACIKKLIKIGKNYYILIIGKSNNKYIFIRLIYNDNYYENLFTFRNEDYNYIYKQLLNNNEPLIRFNVGKSIIYLSYSQENIDQDITFKLKIDEIHNINSDNIKIKYNFNTKFLSNEKMIILSKTSFNNKDFENLCEIKMNATLLNLENNNISDLNPLKSENIKYLQKLNLSNNKIKNIDTLDKLKLNNLKELMLNDNKIVDISILENIKLINLEILYLNNNNISNIEVLENVNFQNLTKLNLSNNNIIDISIFENIEFNELTELNLSKNKIEKILIKKTFSFPNLKSLNLSLNKIQEIIINGRIKLSKIKNIYLASNQIKNIEINKIQKINYVIHIRFIK